jgi:hypothetical protein
VISIKEILYLLHSFDPRYILIDGPLAGLLDYWCDMDVIKNVSGYKLLSDSKKQQYAEGDGQGPSGTISGVGQEQGSRFRGN